MIWLIRNWKLVLLGLVVAVLAYLRIEVGWLRSRLDRAKAQSAAMKKEIEAHETRDQVDNRVAADRDPKRELVRDWSE